MFFFMYVCSVSLFLFLGSALVQAFMPSGTKQPILVVSHVGLYGLQSHLIIYNKGAP